jgi:hypothetical protein
VKPKNQKQAEYDPKINDQIRAAADSGGLGRIV